MLSCEYVMNHKESYDTLLHNGTRLRAQLKSMCGTSSVYTARVDVLDQSVIKGKKEKDIKALLNVRTAYYLNENSVLYAMQCLGEAKLETECHSVADSLAYLMELLSFKAHAKKLLLVMGTEACFPKEVLGDRTKFEMLMHSVLDYLIEHSGEGEMKLSAKMKSLDAQGSGLILSFEILSKKNEQINAKALERIFAHGEHPFGKQPLDLCNCKSIINILRGNVEFSEPDEGTARVSFEFPFANRDPSKELVSVPRLNIFEVEKLNEYTMRWLARRIIVEDKLDPAKIMPNIIRSPVLRPSERPSIIHNGGATSSNRLIADQDLAKKEVIARLRKQNAADTPQPEGSVFALAGGDSSKDSSAALEAAKKELPASGSPALPADGGEAHLKKSGFCVAAEAEEEEKKLPSPAAKAEEKKVISKEQAVAQRLKDMVAETPPKKMEEESKDKTPVEDDGFDNDPDLEYPLNVNYVPNSVGEESASDMNRIPSVETPMSMKSKESRTGACCSKWGNSREQTPDKRLSTAGTRFCLAKAEG